MKPLLLSLIALLSHTLCYGADDLPKLLEVNDGIFRSGRPTENGIRMAKQLGVRTIINLEDSMSNVQKEAGWVQSQGLRYYSYPTKSLSTPNDSKVEEILALLRNPELHPILLHCQHGEDRTGLIIGLHRVFEEGWSPRQAYEEMKDLGFHPFLFALDRYYKEKSGYDLQLVPDFSSLRLDALGQRSVVN